MNETSPTPILSVQELTASWWTAALVNAGYDVTVAQASATKIGTGQMGESHRFNLEYSAHDGRAPKTLVGKFPSSDEGSIAAARVYGAYRREVNFYRKLAPSVGMVVPELIHSEFDPETERFILILKDLAPAAPGDQTRGVELEHAKLALEEAAKLHASHWSDPAIETLPWLFGTKNAFRLSQPMIAAQWEGFQERFQGRIGDNCMEIGKVLVQKFDEYIAGYRGPLCLIHNDFRPDNIAFATPAGGAPITVFDWQTVGVGCAMNDVAYFMGGALPPQIRKANEGELVKHYHDVLVSRGVRDYSFSDAWQDYRRYSVSSFAMAMSISMMVERTERGDAMFITTLGSAAAFVDDVDGLAVLRAL